MAKQDKHAGIFHSQIEKMLNEFIKKFTKEEQEMMNEIVEKAVKKIITLIT